MAGLDEADIVIDGNSSAGSLGGSDVRLCEKERACPMGKRKLCSLISSLCGETDEASEWYEDSDRPRIRPGSFLGPPSGLGVNPRSSILASSPRGSPLPPRRLPCLSEESGDVDISELMRCALMRIEFLTPMPPNLNI